MNRLKSFSEKTYHKLIESVNSIDIVNFEKVLENFNFNRYQRISNKIQKELDINLYYIKTYSLSVSSIYPLVSKILETGNFDIPNTEKNTVIITTCAINVLVRENKSVSEKLFKYANENNIKEEDLNEIVIMIENINFLFTDISKNFGKYITKFSQMLAYTQLLIPFTTILTSLMEQGKLTNNMLKDLPSLTDNITYKLLINRIMHKLEIIISSTDKFQNIENIKPLLVNWELKTPGLKPNKVKI